MSSNPLFPGRRQHTPAAAVAVLGVCVVAAVAVVISVSLSSGPQELLQPSARLPQLSYLTREDPPWVATKQKPFEYFESQSEVNNSRALSFWPGQYSWPQNISRVPERYQVWGDPRPNLMEERPPLEGTLDWAPGNGYGVVLGNGQDGTVFSGTPIVTHGFMAQMCTKSEECQNADVCKDGKCKPAFFDGLDAVKAAVEAAEAAKWPKQKSFGQQQLRAQLTVLREIDAQTAADEKRLSRARRATKPALANKPARLQGLAMGGGTPVDFTFGVGADGEPPYHLQTVAESVRNGLLDPNAPEVLPYTRVGGSGTTGQMAAVGYMQPLPRLQQPAQADAKPAEATAEAPAGAIEGTVAPSA